MFFATEPDLRTGLALITTSMIAAGAQITSRQRQEQILIDSYSSIAFLCRLTMPLQNLGRQNGLTQCHSQATREAVRESVCLEKRKTEIQQLSTVRSIISFQTQVIALNPPKTSTGLWFGPMPGIDRNTQ